MAGIINIATGEIKIAEDLVVRPGYTFRVFQKTQYCSRKDETRIAGADDPDAWQSIGIAGKTFDMNGNDFGVSLLFHGGVVSCVSLFCSGHELAPWPDEAVARAVYLKILEHNGLEERNSFDWGEIAYEYDRHMGAGYIEILYDERNDQNTKDGSMCSP